MRENTEQRAASRFEFDGIAFDGVSLALFRNGKRVAVEPLPRRILLHLLSHRGTLIPSTLLLDSYCGSESGPGAITTAVERLRRALGEPGRSRIVTVRGSRNQEAGYRFDGDVKMVSVGRSEVLSNGVLMDAERREILRARTISDFLTNVVLRAADVSGHGPAVPLSSTDVLDQMSASAGAQFAQFPETEAGIRIELGERYYRLSRFHAASNEFERAGQLLAAAVADSDASQLLVTQYGHARVKMAQSRLDEGEAIVRTADATAIARGLVKSPQVALAAASARTVWLAMNQRYAEALAEARAATTLTDELKQDDLGARFAVRRYVAEMLLRVGDFDFAQAQIDEMLSAPYSPESVGEVLFARAQVQLARLRCARNQFSGAEVPLLAARDALTRRLGPNEYTLAQVEEEIGRVYQETGDFVRAKDGYREAYRILTHNFGSEHQGARINLVNMALVDLSDGQPESALRVLEVERQWFVLNMNGDRSPVVQLIDFFRVRALLDIGAWRPAAALLSDLDPSQMSKMALCAYWDATLQAERARVMMLSGRSKEGRPLLEDAVDRMRAGAAPATETRRYMKLLDRDA